MMSYAVLSASVLFYAIPAIFLLIAGGGILLAEDKPDRPRRTPLWLGFVLIIVAVMIIFYGAGPLLKGTP